MTGLKKKIEVLETELKKRLDERKNELILIEIMESHLEDLKVDLHNAQVMGVKA